MNVGAEQVASLMLGEMGVKSAILGETEVYSRPGGYIYLMLDTSSTRKNTDKTREIING